MNLTDKAKEDFLQYYWDNHIFPLNMTFCERSDIGDFFDTIKPLLQNAFIIEWFDSVGIFIVVRRTKYHFYSDVRNKELGLMSQTDYLKSSIEAIKKANVIYNNL